MKVHHVVLCFIVAGSALLLLGCPPTTVTPPPPETTVTADQLVDEGIALMKAQDWDGALSKFSEAVLTDPTNGRAVLGYSALNVASIMSDPNVVSLAQHNLGFVNYPSTMNAVLVPDNWMDTLQSPYSGIIPTIANQAFYDGKAGTAADGILDPSERLLAFAAWFATHNSGFSSLASVVGTALGTRVDSAVTAIKGLSDSAQFTLTWDMFTTAQPDSSSWPYKNGQPMSIVIGKAELLTLASSLEMVRGFTYLGQVYSLELPLGEYWTSYNPIDGTKNDPTNKPFETFLQLNSDAATQLAGAKSSYTAATSDFSTALTAMMVNRAGFFVSSDATTGIFSDSTSWNNFVTAASIARRAAQEVNTSLTTNSKAIFPLNMGSADPNNWPTTVIAGTTIGVNFGIYFNTPISLIGTIIELSTGTWPSGEASGEPVYWDLGTTTFTVVTSSTLPGSGDFTDIDKEYFVRIPDASFGGTLDLNSVPVDNTSTKYTFTMSWIDDPAPPGNTAGIWDPGETINWADWYPQVEGLINPADSAYTGGPAAYYSTSGAITDVTNDLLAPYTNSGNYDALRTALEASPYFYRGSVTLICRVGNGVYLPIAPNYIAWNSFATKGTSGYDTHGDPITSAGSIWWYFGNLIPQY